MKHEIFLAGKGLVESRDDEKRMYTRWDGDGNVVESRPYTDEENAAADAAAAAEELAVARVELERRIALMAAPEELARVQRLTFAAAGVADGAEWKQPAGAHDAYPQGFVVTFGGKSWESLMDANVWQPGVTGWREVVEPGGGYPGWAQPAGGHDAYKTGDRVSFEGKCFESNRDGNVWSPAVLPAGWDEVPCEG